MTALPKTLTEFQAQDGAGVRTTADGGFEIRRPGSTTWEPSPYHPTQGPDDE